MGNQNDSEIVDTISMTLDDGTELECEVIAKFEVEGKKYIALFPDKVVDGFEEGDVFFYQYKELDTEDDLELIMIEDEDEFEKVADAFDEILDEQEFNAVSEDE